MLSNSSRDLSENSIVQFPQSPKAKMARKILQVRNKDVQTSKVSNKSKYSEDASKLLERIIVDADATGLANVNHGRAIYDKYHTKHLNNIIKEFKNQKREFDEYNQSILKNAIARIETNRAKAKQVSKEIEAEIKRSLELEQLLNYRNVLESYSKMAYKVDPEADFSKLVDKAFKNTKFMNLLLANNISPQKDLKKANYHREINKLSQDHFELRKLDLSSQDLANLQKKIKDQRKRALNSAAALNSKSAENYINKLFPVNINTAVVNASLSVLEDSMLSLDRAFIDENIELADLNILIKQFFVNIKHNQALEKKFNPFEADFKHLLEIKKLQFIAKKIENIYDNLEFSCAQNTREQLKSLKKYKEALAFFQDNPYFQTMLMQINLDLEECKLENASKIEELVSFERNSAK